MTMRHGKHGVGAALTLVALLGAAHAAQAAVALGVQVGTLGLGGELTAGDASWDARAGYGMFDYNRNVTDSDATYNGKLKLSNGSLLLDWHPGGHLFAITVGAVATGDRVDVTGVPTGGQFTLGGQTYDTSQVGSVNGEIKPGHSVSPYVGLGLGNPLSSNGHLHLSFDIGAVFMGTPVVSLSANCAASLPAGTCAQIQQQLQQSVATESADIRSNVNQLKIWPVAKLGLAYRF